MGIHWQLLSAHAWQMRRTFCYGKEKSKVKIKVVSTMERGVPVISPERKARTETDAYVVIRIATKLDGCVFVPSDSLEIPNTFFVGSSRDPVVPQNDSSRAIERPQRNLTQKGTW